MASLHFPNHEALRLALASGLIPAAIARSTVTVSMPKQGGLWLKFAGDLPGEAYASLQRLGAKAFGVLAAKESQDFPCWPSLLPLRAATVVPTPTEVLFELPVERLPRFLATTERLTSRSATFAILDRTTVVRVMQPPGFLHTPAADCYHPIAGNSWCLEGFAPENLPLKLLDTDGLTLARPRGGWRCLPAVDWHTTRNTHALGVSTPVPRNPTDAGVRLTIPLKMLKKRSGDAAEESVWIAEGGRELLALYFRDWDERSLRRLEFAIARTPHGERILVRPSRNAKIVPFLTAPFQPYSFAGDSRRVLIPADRRLVPTPRKQVLDSLPGPNSKALAFLEPRAHAYSVCRLNDPIFRTLAECVEFTVPPTSFCQSSDLLNALFAFPGFVVAAESKPAGESLAPPKLPDPPKEKKPRSGSWLQRVSDRLFPAKKERSRVPAISSKPEGGEAQAEPEYPNEWAARRQHLERTLIAMPAGVADPIRSLAWRELAQLAHTMGHAQDAAFAWVTAIWFKPVPPAAWYEAWFRAELDAAKITGTPSDEQLTERSADLPLARVFAARLSMLATGESPTGPAEIGLKMSRIVQNYSFELSIRHCWLARLAAAELSKGDTLGLACERDAILARLAEAGPDADLDSPSFLRYQGKLGVERFHATADWLRRTRDAAQRWLKAMAGGGRLQWAGLEADLPSTRAYADLIFACGLAKLGDRTKCREWMDAAETLLNKAEGPGVEPLVHRHLLERFRRAIRTRNRWENGSAAAPPSSMPEFAQKELSRYAVEKLQSHLSVFGMQPRTDPYGYRGLQSLLPWNEYSNMPDARQLLAEAGQDRTARHLPPRILLALELANDVATAAEVLALLPLALELFPESLRSVSPQSDVHLPFTRLAVRAVELAGQTAVRFGLAREFAGVCMSLLHATAEGNHSTREVLRSTAGRIFASCRTLGLFDEISELLNGLTITSSSPIVEQLPHAIGWFAIGEDDRGLKILNDARRKLFEGGPSTEKERGDTALAYVHALAHAPAAMVPGRVEELFQRLERIPMSGAASRYYALRPLEIIDAAIAAVVTEDFAPDPAARTWMAEDEFRIRQKISRDLERALGGEAP